MIHLIPLISLYSSSSSCFSGTYLIVLLFVWRPMILLVSLVFVGFLVLPFAPSIHFVSPVSHSSCRSSCCAWIFGFSMATVIILLLRMVQCFYSSSSLSVPFVLLFLLSYFFSCCYRSSIGIFRLLLASVAMLLWFLSFPLRNRLID
jgi:hypothetical protein